MLPSVFKGQKCQIKLHKGHKGRDKNWEGFTKGKEKFTTYLCGGMPGFLEAPRYMWITFIP